MNAILATLTLALGAWLQASPLNSCLPLHLDPLLIMVVAWGVALGARQGAIYGLLAGAVEDMLIGGGGIYVLPKLLIGLAAGGLKPMLYYRQAIVVMPLVALCTALQETFVMAEFALRGHGLFLRHLGAIALPEVLGNLLITWPLYALVRVSLKYSQERWGLHRGIG